MMKVFKNDQHWVVVIAKGEELISSLKDLCQKESIYSAWVQGLGGSLEATLGLYNLETKEYEQHQLADGPYEVAGLQGNVSVFNGEVALHLHASLAGADLQAKAGHIHKLVIGGTMELMLTPLQNPLERRYSKDIGLSLID